MLVRARLFCSDARCAAAFEAVDDALLQHIEDVLGLSAHGVLHYADKRRGFVDFDQILIDLCDAALYLLMTTETPSQ